jgi:hypothetical protein
MTFLLIASFVILFAAMAAQEIDKRRLTETELATFECATFPDSWRLYPVIILSWVFVTAIFRTIVIFCITWGIFVQRRLLQSNLSKGFIQIDMIISPRLLVFASGLLLSAYSFD